MNDPEKRALPRPRRGDVFLARLDPTEGSEQAGTRPVVVVTRDAINANSPVIVAVPFTDAANPKRIYPSHVWVPKGSAGLRLDSIAKAEQIRAIEVSRFTAYCGKLAESQVKQLDEAIRIALAL
ncbi:MAG TPA: type II toxin-antitoxin system PemK/MazF family toxin [Terriglobales bacterium]